MALSADGMAHTPVRQWWIEARLARPDRRKGQLMNQWSGLSKWSAARMAVTAIGLASHCCAWSEQRITVEASRVVEPNETVQAARAQVERELKKQALSKVPTVIEWDRHLNGTEYRETVREMTAGVVKLESLTETVEVVSGGRVKVTIAGTAVVDDKQAKLWASRLDETERLRGELADARSSESRRHGQRSNPSGSGDGRPGEWATSTTVRMRLGEGQQLAALADATARARAEASKRAVRAMLQSATVEMGSVEAHKTIGSDLTRFSFGVRWNLVAVDALEKELAGKVQFRAGTEGEGLKMVDGIWRHSGDWRLADDLIWTRISLEIDAGVSKAKVPVAFPGYRVDVMGESACRSSYGRDFVRAMGGTQNMGWCLVVDGRADKGSTTRGFDVRSKANLYLKDSALGGITGPEVSWTIQWADGSTERVLPVVQWVGTRAQ